jgi:glycosyltransferase involved in cell wall biosynthesis
MRPLRICIVVPWFRSLGQIYGRALASAGHRVNVITTDRHFEGDYGFVPEVVLPARGGGRPRWRELRDAHQRVRVADICLIEETSDPLFWSLTQVARHRALMVHDARPHDWASQFTVRQRMMRQRQYASADAVVYFSKAVAEAHDAGKRHVVLPLLSEMPDDWRPPPPPGTRANFAFVGRLYPYKNLHAVQELVEEVLEGTGEELLIFGDGPVVPQSMRTSRVVRRTFEFSEVGSLIAGCRAVLMPYEGGSQSGVQLFSMQCGVPPVISDLPGLLEYGIEDQPVVRRDHLRGDLRAWVERLLDDRLAQELATAVRRAYDDRFSQSVNVSPVSQSVEALA